MPRAPLPLLLLASACGDPAGVPAGPTELTIRGVQVLSDTWAADTPSSDHGGDSNGAVDAGERVRLTLDLATEAGPLASDAAVAVTVEMAGAAVADHTGPPGDPFEVVAPFPALGPLELTVAAPGGLQAQAAAPVYEVTRPQLDVRRLDTADLQPGGAYTISLAVSRPATLTVVSESPDLAVVSQSSPAPGEVTFDLYVHGQAQPAEQACLEVRSRLALPQGDYGWRHPFCLGIVASAPDLILYEDRLRADIVLDEMRFDADSCALLEGCVEGPGVRRLLRFDVSTANIGGVDLVVGRPEDDPDSFTYSECHDHHHFTEFAEYTLSRPDAREVAAGHKQAFCLEDTDVYPPAAGRTDIPGDARYDCDDQGISRGWFDAYPSHLDCQWVDVTDLPPGDYRLRVRINPHGELPDADLTNNDAVVDVVLPEAVDPSAACPDPPDLFSDRTDPARNCGWSIGQVAACDPGSVVRLGCAGVPGFGADCQQGSCLGDPMLRVCAGEGEAAKCLRGLAVREGDNACRSFCPSVRFHCPAEGRYTAWIAPKRQSEAALTQCQLQADTGSLTDLCEPGVGYGRTWKQTCGWRLGAPARCTPGQRYSAGCAQQPCLADTLIRVCPGDAECPPDGALGHAEGDCPQAEFTCPPAGEVILLTTNADGDVVQGACAPEIRPPSG